MYEDITMKDVERAVTITAYYSKIPASDAPQAMTDETPAYRNIRIKNLKATSSKSVGVIIGLPESLVRNVELENVEITAARSGLTIRNAEGVRLKGVRVVPKEGPSFEVQNAQVEGLAGAMR